MILPLHLQYRPILLAVAVLFLLLDPPLVAQQSPVTFTCPERLEGVAQELRNPPSGWNQGKLGYPLWLAGITLFDGPVEDEVALAPDIRRNAASKVEDVWDLDPKERRPLWMQCHYANTTVTLSKSLGVGFRECIARYDPKLRVSGNPSMETLQCR